jgi:NAD+ kinase
MRVALVFSTIKPDYFEYLDLLFDEFEKYGITPAIELEFRNLLTEHNETWSNCPCFNDAASFKNNADIVLSLGGDGTFLKTVLYVRDSQIPILGINMGRLGFLANLNKDKIEEAVRLMIKEDYTLTVRSLIQMESQQQYFGKHNFALNELAIHKKDSASMISVQVMVGNDYLNNYWADGLIISTPTGSTGYSLSCGGPIVSPETPVFVITPIAPHNLNVRPIIIKDDLEIRVKVNDRNYTHLLTLDSRSELIQENAEIVIRKAPFSILTVQFSNFSFFDTIRDKLLWGLDKRN